jgi:hypothetical protein
METQHPLMASTRGYLDQSNTTGKRRQTSYHDDANPIGSKVIIFPKSHRAGTYMSRKQN